MYYISNVVRCCSGPKDSYSTWFSFCHRDLLAGVDTLRHLSQVLASVDKITDCTEAPLS